MVMEIGRNEKECVQKKKKKKKKMKMVWVG